MTQVGRVGETNVVTIEGVGVTEAGKRVQDAWMALDVAQCGYCQPGQIMSAVALIARTPKPTDADIDAAMSGNICRCATYRLAVPSEDRRCRSLQTGDPHHP
jgi:isoquinoline 1-oxidoreductase alpha subunit